LKVDARYDNYRFYGEVCLAFGILLLVIGIALLSLTTTWYTTFLGTHVNSPYLAQGITLVVVGIILIVFSQLLQREYRFRISRDLYDKALSPSPPPPPPSTFSKTPSFCPYCGTQNITDSVFCSKCGKKLT
jgi:hypothetical protein